MRKASEEYILQFLEELRHMDYIRPSDIPNIPLYMDQVTQFMEEHLRSALRYPDDKIMTKTMINNYTKNDLLPPPEKKKYSREHILLLIFIYYMKNFLSMSDIQKILGPLSTHFFEEKGELPLSDIYDRIFSMSKDAIHQLYKGVLRDMKLSEELFAQVGEEQEKEYLTNFSFICMLSFDIYIKKMMIEHILDTSGEFTFPEPSDNP